jgi:hypothetical protein
MPTPPTMLSFEIILCLHNQELLALFSQEGKQHVSFPGITQNGSVKQFTHGIYRLINKSRLWC